MGGCLSLVEPYVDVSGSIVHADDELRAASKRRWHRSASVPVELLADGGRSLRLLVVDRSSVSLSELTCLAVEVLQLLVVEVNARGSSIPHGLEASDIDVG